MSGKLLHSLTDENKDLQKQIGCMNGFFQLFDRHHFLTGRRINSSHSQKKLPPGQNRNHETETNSALQRTTEKNLKKFVKEKQRVSTESSRTSFSSSSCSSSLSSLDYNKTAQPEPSLLNRTNFPQNPTRDLPVNQPKYSLQSSQPFLDLRDVVKDSIYREARGLSIKTTAKEEAVGNSYKYMDSPRPLSVKATAKEEAVGNTFKYMDSPRPLQPPKSVKPRVSGLNDSFRVLAKLREAPRNSKEEKDGSLLLALRDAPRLSYDGRISQHMCKSTIKLKELPRLSLDSREVSIRGSTSEAKSNFLLKDPQRRNGNSSKMLNPMQEQESCKQTSSVVAKLMGLEAFPQSMSTSENPVGIICSCPTDKCDPFSKPSKTTDENRKNWISGSPRNLHKEPISPRLKNAGSIMGPTASSKFPIEPAPWKQPDGSQVSHQPGFKHGETTTKAPNSPSVYGEIEKRLAELEFKKSGKDLRALKQILEAMQKTKEISDSKREQTSKFACQTSNNSSSYQSSKLAANPRSPKSSDPISTVVKGSYSPRSYKSPIVIMKPVKLTGKTGEPASTVIPTDSMSGLCKPSDTADGRKVEMRTAKDLTTRSNHSRDPFNRLTYSTDKNINVGTTKSIPTLKVPRHIIGENTTSSATVSPRLQQKKSGLQKQSRPTTPSIDSSKTSRQRTRQPIESSSPGRKLRPKSPSSKQCKDQLSETSSDMRDLSHQGDTISLQSESNISLGSHIDTEVTSTNQTDKINTTFFQHYCLKQRSPEGLSEDRSMAEPAIAILERPSPVSVLDDTFYRDEPPSPVKKISIAFTDDEALNHGDEDWNPADLAQLSNSRKPSFHAEMEHKKLEDIQHSVQNLHQFNSAKEEPIINYIGALNESTNPDHRYISEILLASGLLRDIESGLMIIHLHPSGHPINPNLFLALEQTKVSTGLLQDKHCDKRITTTEPDEKIQRKLIFDAVNEILLRKLSLEGPPKQWFSPNKLVGRKRGLQLLGELCLEVDQLKSNNSNRSVDEDDDYLRSIIREDLMHQSFDWTDYDNEIPGVALDVERLIFKDLITEIVKSERAGPQGRPGGHCRKLFSK